MNRNRDSYTRRKSSLDSIERRMDKWVETGRQLVDGVAGNRPGQRRKENRHGFNNMGRWVGEKIDWLLEDEDEDDFSQGIEPLIEDMDKYSQIKRPISAISLRVPKILSSTVPENVESDFSNEWPDKESFTLDRWERSPSRKQEFNDSKDSFEFDSDKKSTHLRPLPKSSRRRN